MSSRLIPAAVFLGVLAGAWLTPPGEKAPTRDGQEAGERPAAERAGREALFDGRTLRGWKKVGGGATYTVDDGCIVGEVGPGPNTFLRTERSFSDFVLEVEVRLDVPGNSGIQFRSHQRDGDGRVYGYQCEIDPSERSWSGGIYDEGRRGWLFNLEGDERAAARRAFRVEGWNRYRIEAIGPRLRTWVNDVPCADFTDTAEEADREGFVALQVHSGKQGRIRWRNIRIEHAAATSKREDGDPSDPGSG